MSDNFIVLIGYLGIIAVLLLISGYSAILKELKYAIKKFKLYINRRKRIKLLLSNNFGEEANEVIMEVIDENYKSRMIELELDKLRIVKKLNV
jgi:hypothetical protein